jgi:hypothetical protein
MHSASNEPSSIRIMSKCGLGTSRTRWRCISYVCFLRPAQHQCGQLRTGTRDGTDGPPAYTAVFLVTVLEITDNGLDQCEPHSYS